MADLLSSLRARAELTFEGYHGRRLRTQFAAARRTVSQPRNVLLFLLFVVALAGALVLGRSLGRGDDGRPASLGSSEVGGGRLALSGWSGWLPAKTPAAATDLLPGAAVTKPLLLDGVTVLAGDVPDGDVPRLLGAITSRRPQGTELAAGRLHVRLYTGELAGHAPLTATMLLVPTQDGVSAAICIANPRVSTTATNDCELLTTTTRLRRSAPAPASPDAAGISALSTAISRLDGVRRRDVAALAANATSGRQRQAATRMQAAYARAAEAVRAIRFTALAAGSAGALLDNLTAAARGYRALGAAAEAHSPTGFRLASGRVGAADRAVARSLAELRLVGYGRG